MRSNIMANDTSHRIEFKERALKRVQDALNGTAKPVELKSAPREIMVRGIEPKEGEEV